MILLLGISVKIKHPLILLLVRIPLSTNTQRTKRDGNLARVRRWPQSEGATQSRRQYSCVGSDDGHGRHDRETADRAREADPGATGRTAYLPTRGASPSPTPFTHRRTTTTETTTSRLALRGSHGL